MLVVGDKEVSGEPLTVPHAWRERPALDGEGDLVGDAEGIRKNPPDTKTTRLSREAGRFIISDQLPCEAAMTPCTALRSSLFFRGMFCRAHNAGGFP